MERPILMSTYMVQAILDGRKTQTRRIIKHAPELIEESLRNLSGTYQCYDALKCKYGIPGDELYVKETYTIDENNNIYFKTSSDYPVEFLFKNIKWKPSLFMPKKYSRIKLAITNIKVEQLLQISNKDAINEGIKKLYQSRTQLMMNGDLYFDYSTKASFFNNGIDARSSYFSLWDSINGKDSAKLNPWVWAITFKRIA